MLHIPDTQEVVGNCGSRSQNRRIVPKDREDECIVKTKQHKCVCKDTIHNPQDTALILSETCDTTQST